MSIASDLRVILNLLSPVSGKTHAERLESFYSGQARDYDIFRERLLHGRSELIRSVPHEDGQVWLDLGAGTGFNLEFAAETLPRKEAVFLVDLSPSLLAVARRRVARNGWSNVHCIEGDVTTFSPRRMADLVTFSYSLTMIPDWQSALLHAFDLLKPGAWIGVVDFYISRKHPREHMRGHGWFTRHFWRVWFERDNVFLSPDHLGLLTQLFDTVSLSERMGRIPYLPGLKVPHYLFLGRKSSSASASVAQLGR